MNALQNFGAQPIRRVLITLVALKKQKVPFHSFSFSENLQIAEAILSLSCMLCRLRASFLRNAIVDRFGKTARHTGAATFAYNTDCHFGDFLTGILQSTHVSRDIAVGADNCYSRVFIALDVFTELRMPTNDISFP